MPELNPFDLENERKRVRSIAKTREGREALRQELGIVFAEDVADEKNLPVVALLVPSHDAPKKETHYALEMMIKATKNHAVIVPQPIVSSSIVHWSRNDGLVRLYHSGLKFDFALLMDDDMVPPPDALVKLLAHDKEVVAAGCTVRLDPPLPNFRVYFPEEHNYRTAKTWNGDGLMDVGAVGTGFFLVKREALDAVGEYYLSCEHERQFMGMTDEFAKEMSAKRRDRAAQTGNKWWFEFLKQPNGDGEWGEDISFCFKAMQCGLPIFVDTSVRPGHIGPYAYSLNDYCGPIKAEEQESNEPVLEFA